jgi:hypothetical protein
MNRNQERDWQKGPNCIKKKFEENHEGLEEDLIPCAEKDILERYLDNSDEPSPFFKGATISFFVCITFWAILIFLIT